MKTEPDTDQEGGATMAMQLITDITLELTGDERLYMASAKQGDKRTRFIRIALTNNGKVFTIPTGYIVIANIKSQTNTLL